MTVTIQIGGIEDSRNLVTNGSSIKSVTQLLYDLPHLYMSYPILQKNWILSYPIPGFELPHPPEILKMAFLEQ